MATIYDKKGEYLTEGLEEDTVSDQAIKVARKMAAARGEEVYIEYADGYVCILPDGSYGDVPAWVTETEVE